MCFAITNLSWRVSLRIRMLRDRGEPQQGIGRVGGSYSIGDGRLDRLVALGAVEGVVLLQLAAL